MDKQGLPASGNAGGASAGSLDRIAYDACPLCNGTRIPVLREASCARHPLYQSGLSPTMVWLRCDDCKHVFTNGYFSSEAAEKVFSKTNEGQRLGHDLERQRSISSRMVSRVELYGCPDGQWLDVGFGNGSLLFTAAEFGFDVVGTDLRRENVELLRQVGYEGYAVDIPELAQSHHDCFGVVSMADVLEHMVSPVLGVESAAMLLRHGGVLLVSLPAFDSPVWQFLDGADKNPYWGEIEHYHNFSRERLYKLLSDHGFGDFSYGISDRYRACMEIVARKLK